MSDDFGAVMSAAQESGATLPELSLPSRAETATPAEPTAAATHTPNTAHAGGVADANPAGSALPSQSATTIAPEVLAQARQHFESGELKPYFELAKEFQSGGSLAETVPYLEMLSRDHVGFYKALGDHLRSVGQLPAESAAPVAAAPSSQPFALPEADLRSEDGSVSAYSSKAVADIINGLRSEFDARLAPVDRMQTERAEADIRTKAETQAQSAVARAEKHIPDFQQLRPEIHRLLAADFNKPKAFREFDGNIYAAAHVARTALLPSLEQAANERARATLNAKAAASTEGPSTRSSARVDTTPPKNFGDAWARNPQLAEAAVGEIFR